MHTIRLVQESDLENLADIIAKVFTEADKEKPWDKEHALKNLEYWFKKQPDMFFGVFDEKEMPIGAMVVNIKPWRTVVRCTDGVIFVDTPYQKQGLAKELFKIVIKEAMEKYDATTFEAITFAGKKFPLTWYEKIGVASDRGAVLIKGDCQDILDKLS